jgi:redox-sensitive bicupin YhaK (pirin superfamily)
MHPHRDMEIITVVLDGALEHKDSLGTGSVIRPGDVQKMSAGSGIRHSEFNHSATEPVHFLQIWIEPRVHGVTPSYAEAHFPASERQGRFRLVAAPDGSDGALPLHQDAELYLARLSPGETAEHTIASSRRLWLQLAYGRVRLQGTELGAGDGAAIEGETAVAVTGVEESELLLFDLPG